MMRKVVVGLAVMFGLVDFSGAFEVHGCVYDEAGGGCVDKVVMLALEENGEGFPDDISFVTRTDAQGRFVFTNVSPPGVYALIAGEGYAPQWLEIDGKMNVSDLVGVRPHPVKLPSLHVSVSPATAGRGSASMVMLPPAQWIIRAEKMYSESLLADVYTFTNVFAGDYDLQVFTATNGLPFYFPVASVRYNNGELHVAPPKTVEELFEGNPEGAEQLKADYPDAVLKEYVIHIWQDDDAEKARVFTVQTLQVELPQDDKNAKGLEATTVVDVAGGTTIEGTVYDEAGGGVPGIGVGLVPDFSGLTGLEEIKAATAAARGTFTDRKGRFSFDDVSPGVWNLVVSGEDDLAENYPAKQVAVDDSQEGATVLFHPYTGGFHRLSVNIPQRVVLGCWVHRLPKEEMFMREGIPDPVQLDWHTRVFTNLYAGDYELYIYTGEDEYGMTFPLISVGDTAQGFHVEEPENPNARQAQGPDGTPIHFLFPRTYVEYVVNIWQEDDVENMRVFTVHSERRTR